MQRLMNVTSTNCSGYVSPKIEITNYGSNDLTEADIQININGTIVDEINWTGSLAFMESAQIDAGEIGFELQVENTLRC